ncbi:MAG: ubiquinone/menaquinone biosynthesis methyltransferase [Chthoniobacterales bacterium]
MNPEYVKNLFRSIAGRYALANHLLSCGMDFWWRRCVAKKIQQWNPKTLLDVATGNGELAFAIAKKIPTVQTTAVDFCHEMLEQARLTQVKSKNLYSYSSENANIGFKTPMITFLEADGLELPFEEKIFDAVTVAFGLRNMVSWEQGLREMHRVLRSRGHLLILDFSIPTSPLLRPFYRFYLHHVLPHFAGLVTGEASAYEYMGGSIEAFPSGEAMCALLTQCGFENARSTALTGGIVTIYTASKET